MDGGKPARERQALFEGNASQSAAYAKHRPSPPQALFDAIATYAGPGAPTEVALDVATGTGQATGGLATRYGRVIGLDVSKAQLAEASSGENAKPNVEFQEGTAESTGLPDSSVDLVTVAQALHWFDQPRAFAEFARVLKPGGVLAAWGYDLYALSTPFQHPPLRLPRAGGLIDCTRSMHYGTGGNALFSLHSLPSRPPTEIAISIKL
mmetsp:Transcript_2367/g.7145  ORF Transcript_2367/g.7145 Transcript_2367/m.7145 type:complete len:208 (+) Transcript_2367:224-847(+)